MRCRQCKSKFEVKYFNQKFCLEKDECISAFREYAKQEKEKKRKREWSKEKKVLKEKLETKTDLEKKLQKSINKIARLLDFGWPCISSGRPLGKNPDAGHLWSVGSNPQVRFHLLNIFAQSVEQNQNKGGAPLEYLTNLAVLFGEAIQREIYLLKGLPALHLSKEELREKIKIANRISIRLAKNKRKYSLQERINLRREINKEIGIY